MSAITLSPSSYADFPSLVDAKKQSENSRAQRRSEPVAVPQQIELAIAQAIGSSAQPFSGSVLLLREGKPLLTINKGRGIGKNSSFVIASLSKQITATLVLQAVDAGKLDLNRSLNSYLIDSLDQAGTANDLSVEPSRYDENITLHHLLSHTSGVAQLGEPNKFEPGSQFQYSNLGYSLLGKILERVNQQTLTQQIADLKRTNRLGGLYAEVGTIDNIRQRAPSLAIGLDEVAGVFSASDIEITASLLPAGGIIATTQAFAAFQHQLHSGRLISPRSYQMMTRPHTEIEFLWPNMSYGYGLRINREDGITEYSHTGYLPGYMSMALHYPEFNLDLVMLENLSLNIDNLERVFELHNQIRSRIRDSLIYQKNIERKTLMHEQDKIDSANKSTGHRKTQI